MKRIIIRHGVSRILCKEFKTSYPSVRKALRCERNTDLSLKIRQRALQLGGVVVESEGNNNNK